MPHGPKKLQTRTFADRNFCCMTCFAVPGADVEDLLGQRTDDIQVSKDYILWKAFAETDWIRGNRFFHIPTMWLIPCRISIRSEELVPKLVPRLRCHLTHLSTLHCDMPAALFLIHLPRFCCRWRNPSDVTHFCCRWRISSNVLRFFALLRNPAWRALSKRCPQWHGAKQILLENSYDALKECTIWSRSKKIVS